MGGGEYSLGASLWRSNFLFRYRVMAWERCALVEQPKPEKIISSGVVRLACSTDGISFLDGQVSGDHLSL